jgi:hypothetical protein
MEALSVLASFGIDEKPSQPQQRFQWFCNQTPGFDHGNFARLLRSLAESVCCELMD